MSLVHTQRKEEMNSVSPVTQKRTSSSHDGKDDSDTVSSKSKKYSDRPTPGPTNGTKSNAVDEQNESVNLVSKKHKKRKLKDDEEKKCGTKTTEKSQSDLQFSDNDDGSNVNLNSEESSRKKKRTTTKKKSKKSADDGHDHLEDDSDVDGQLSLTVETDELKEEEVEEENDVEVNEENFQVLGNFEKRSKKKVMSCKFFCQLSQKLF